MLLSQFIEKNSDANVEFKINGKKVIETIDLGHYFNVVLEDGVLMFEKADSYSNMEFELLNVEMIGNF